MQIFPPERRCRFVADRSSPSVRSLEIVRLAPVDAFENLEDLGDFGLSHLELIASELDEGLSILFVFVTDAGETRKTRLFKNKFFPSYETPAREIGRLTRCPLL